MWRNRNQTYTYERPTCFILLYLRRNNATTFLPSHRKTTEAQGLSLPRNVLCTHVVLPNIRTHQWTGTKHYCLLSSPLEWEQPNGHTLMNKAASRTGKEKRCYNPACLFFPLTPLSQLSFLVLSPLPLKKALFTFSSTLNIAPFPSYKKKWSNMFFLNTFVWVISTHSQINKQLLKIPSRQRQFALTEAGIRRNPSRYRFRILPNVEYRRLSGLLQVACVHVWHLTNSQLLLSSQGQKMMNERNWNGHCSDSKSCCTVYHPILSIPPIIGRISSKLYVLLQKYTTCGKH